MNAPDVLVFDLFGTLVFFDDTRIPVEEMAGRRVPMTVKDLPGCLSRVLPGIDAAVFLREVARAGAVLGERKRKEGIEVPTHFRFEAALLALGATPERAAGCAREMAASHMDSLAGAVVCPPGRRRLLEGLTMRHRLALLSNFDDGATARRVVGEAGLDRFFEVMVVSAEEGIRKPSREIFERTCSRLGVGAARCLHVGDTLVEDVEGATGAGLAALWVHPDRSAVSRALGVIGDVEELPAWLARGSFSARDDASR